MNHLDIIIIFISLVGWCLGLRTVTDIGKIFYPIRVFVLDLVWLPSWVKKPILICVACMPSFWGQIIFWLYTYINNISFAWYLPLISVLISVAASFVNDYLWNSYELQKLKIKTLE